MEQPQNYDNEPKRNERLQVNSEQPFNAEPRPNDLIVGNNFLTPSETFYVRHHAPVPDINIDKYHLTVDGIVKQALDLTMTDIMNRSTFPQQTVTVALACAGNRRRELNTHKSVSGLLWDEGAISNAQWTGIRLTDVLHAAGADLQSSTLHVEFLGLDKGTHPDQFYGSSIPMSRAAPQTNDVILAFSMNGKPLTRDHGFPLRVIIPGYIGARSVKWLHKISVINHESHNFFMQKDYKILPQSVTSKSTAEEWWSRLPPVMELNLQSVICDPLNNAAIVPHATTTLIVRGYAISNGHRITRVEVSCDNGAVWHQAKLQEEPVDDDKNSGCCQQQQQEDGRLWNWVLWSVSLENIPAPCQLMCRAFDSAGNTQPQSVEQVWNFRGVMNNAWHRINLKKS